MIDKRSQLLSSNAVETIHFSNKIGETVVGIDYSSRIVTIYCGYGFATYERDSKYTSQSAIAYIVPNRPTIIKNIFTSKGIIILSNHRIFPVPIHLSMREV